MPSLASYALARLVTPITLITATFTTIIFSKMPTITISAFLAIFVALITVLYLAPAFLTEAGGMQVFTVVTG